MTYLSTVGISVLHWSRAIVHWLPGLFLGQPHEHSHRMTINAVVAVAEWVEVLHISSDDRMPLCRDWGGYFVFVFCR